MLIAIENRRRVAQLAKHFRHQMFATSDRGPKKLTLGHHGATFIATVSWFKELDFWFAYDELDTRYWNGFGLGQPFDVPAARALIVELNPPKQGINRLIQGVFAEDDRGQVWLVHRGKLGGSKKGIGKGFLRAVPPDLRRVMVDGERETEVLVVARLDSNKLLSALGAFVRIAARYKAARLPDTRDVDLLLASVYAPEFSGKMTYRRSDRDVIAEWRHGRVVDALHAALAALGVSGCNDKKRDLFVAGGDEELLFEVKTASDPQSIYTAVGQLIWHGNSETRKVAVLPLDVGDDSRHRLSALGIDVVTYEWDKTCPRINGLENVVKAVHKMKRPRPIPAE